jgi:hypothetical protein
VLFLKNAEGKPSSSFTMMFMSFGVVTLWLFFSIFQNLGPIHIRPFVASDAMAYLTPILALYWGRKQQDLSVSSTTKPTVE